MIFVHIFHKKDHSSVAGSSFGKGVHCLRFDDEAQASRNLEPYLREHRGLSAVRVVPGGPLLKVQDVQQYTVMEDELQAFGRGKSVAGVLPKRRHWAGVDEKEAGLPALVMQRMGYAGVEALNGANTFLQGSVIWDGSFQKLACVRYPRRFEFTFRN